jgi:hypothetical protein
LAEKAAIVQELVENKAGFATNPAKVQFFSQEGPCGAGLLRKDAELEGLSPRTSHPAPSLHECRNFYEV